MNGLAQWGIVITALVTFGAIAALIAPSVGQGTQGTHPTTAPQGWGGNPGCTTGGFAAGWADGSSGYDSGDSGDDPCTGGKVIYWDMQGAYHEEPDTCIGTTGSLTETDWVTTGPGNFGEVRYHTYYCKTRCVTGSPGAKCE